MVGLEQFDDEKDGDKDYDVEKENHSPRNCGVSVSFDECEEGFLVWINHFFMNY